MKELSKLDRNGVGSAPRLDDTDRRLLRLLAEDSTLSYAAMGKALHLSPPAVHERAKRLKQDGVIKNHVAVLDGVKLGRPLLAFVQVETRTLSAANQLLKLKEFPDVEEIHTLSGDSAMLLKIRTRDTRSLDNLLEKIRETDGVCGARSHIVLSTHLERGPGPLDP